MADFCKKDDSSLEEFLKSAASEEIKNKWACFFREQDFVSRVPFLQIRYRDGLFEAVSLGSNLGGGPGGRSGSSLAGRVLLRIDLDGDKRNYHRKNFAGRKDLMLKAVGFECVGHRVLDLTCGLGRDSVYLAHNGCHVTAVERDPLLYFLFASSLDLSSRRFRGSLGVRLGDARLVLGGEGVVDADGGGGVVDADGGGGGGGALPEFAAAFYDPMYPEVGNTALPKKEILFLREHLPASEDRREEEELIAFCRLRLKEKTRLVIKRHPRFEALPSQIPDHVYKGESVSYGVYFGRTRN